MKYNGDSATLILFFKILGFDVHKPFIQSVVNSSKFKLINNIDMFSATYLDF